MVAMAGDTWETYNGLHNIIRQGHILACTATGAQRTSGHHTSGGDSPGMSSLRTVPV
jgi:hypothetical protein